MTAAAADVFISDSMESILKKAGIPRLGKRVAIKTHFGEEGCTTFINPEIVKEAYMAIKETGREAALVETCVLYPGPRISAEGHTGVAKRHGFGFAPVDIIDGEKGEQSMSVDVPGSIAKTARLGKGLRKYDSMAVITHFKGHIVGYGGVFKNLGMGLSSRAGKLHMHAGVSPKIDSKACSACWACVEGCGSSAIVKKDGRAWIDPSRCTGCAMCIAVCPHDAVQIPWAASTNRALQEKIVDYARAALEVIPPEKCVFITVMKSITKECDCMGKAQKPFMPDAGILTSHDPVALEAACLDLAEERSGGEFSRINPHDKMIQARHAEASGLGSRAYRLVMA